MGQQQLLLLVLGIVIVGLAVVVGIQAFGENQKKANADALVNDGVRIASDAQAWALKPTAFGGPSTSGDVGLATFSQLGYATTSGRYVNLNGEFEMSGSTGNDLVIHGCSDAQGNDVVVTVSGTAPTNISTATTTVASCTFA